ncbi:MAG: hypothetical protein ACKVXR_13000 [Planctomycetota bacterium]
MKTPFRVLLALPLLLACFACSSTSSNHKADAPSSDGGGKPATAKADAAEEEAEKMLKKEHELEYARMELEIAKLSSAAEEREADASVKEATVKLEAAKKELDNFLNLDKPTQVADRQLSLDRSQQNMEESRQELAELEAMYKQEDFAELTKELVLSRGRKRLEFSQRGYELAKKGQEELMGHELPKKEKELTLAFEKAEKALQEAQARKSRGALEIKLKLMRAEHRVEEVAREIEKMKKKSEKKEATA